jgi:hypothetical protein
VELLRKKRVPACRSCRYDVVCDHAWTGYIAHYGDAEFAPVRGEKVLDPAWCYSVARYRRTGDRLTRARPALAVSGAADNTDVVSRNSR